MTPPATIRELIDTRAAQYRDKPFLIALADEAEDGSSSAPDTLLTFGQLQADCRLLEERFHEAGLHRGDVISVFMGNGSQTARLLLAAMYSGLVANPINLLCQGAQTRHIISHSDTHLIFATPQTRAQIDTALAGLHAGGLTREVPCLITESNDAHLPVCAIPQVALAEFEAAPVLAIARDGDTPTSDDDALLMYTSGTTGIPKGVLLTHRNLLANASNISMEHRLVSSDRVLASLPLYHINGLVVTLLAPLVHGGSVVMPPRFSARTFWRDAIHHRCTWINVVPTIVAYLLNAEDDPTRIDRSALKFCRSASAALPPEHHRAFESRFGIDIIETMGMTETAAPIFSNPYQAEQRKIGSIGLPSGVEAKVIDKDGSEVPVGQSGEIVVRGAQVMRGYYKQPEETRTAFTSDGWLRTGDLGYCDDGGYFFINGRAKELIIKGGENIAPREIDEALLKHPEVLEAAAVGIPDSAYGQEIVAFVVPRAAGWCDVESLRTHCLRELGRYKTPKEFRFTCELPRGPSGKVQRLKLLQQ